MYAHRVDNVEIAFINGYLAPISLMMDYVTNEVGFDYYFHHLGGDVLRYSLTETVRGLLERSFLGYTDQNGKAWFETDRIHELVSGCSLSRMDNWKTNLAGDISEWFGETFMDALTSVHPNTPWPRSFLIDDFVDVLSQFFRNEPTECWTIEGAIKNELQIHWGGLHCDDYFFHSHGQYYHLHFDLCD